MKYIDNGGNNEGRKVNPYEEFYKVGLIRF